MGMIGLGILVYEVLACLYTVLRFCVCYTRIGYRHMLTLEREVSRDDQLQWIQEAGNTLRHDVTLRLIFFPLALLSALIGWLVRLLQGER